MSHETRSRRRFKSPYWDVPPVGFEHVTPKEYKAMQAAGQVPHSVVNPSSQHLQGTKFAHGYDPDPLTAAKSAAAAINAALLKGKPKTAAASTRQARRLYVGNIPFGFTENDMIDFFRSNLEAANFTTQTGNPVLACQINLDKNFAFLEFRSVEETSNAMALDGVLCKGQALKIRRPHDYQPIPGSEPPPLPTLGSSDDSHNHSNPNAVSTVVADSPNKIYIGGIPTYLTDDQIKEILASFGQLRAFNLIRDPSTLASKGYAFCEYLDPGVTEGAIMGLNGFDIGDKKLVVQRASVGAKTGPSSGTPGPTGVGSLPSVGINPITVTGVPVQIQVPGLPSITPISTPRVLTEVLCLMNMVEPEELKDDDEYRDILEDIEEECARYGSVKSIVIPRPSRHSSGNSHQDKVVPGLGKVFVEFNSATEAQRAQMNLAGRRFANRVVVTSYFDRDRYKNREF